MLRLYEPGPWLARVACDAFSRAERLVFESYILTLVICMAEERKQTDRLRLWLWRGAGVLLIVVFFTTRFLMRDRLAVREIQVSRQQLISTVSTNGRVEPEGNHEIHSPVSTDRKSDRKSVTS